MEVCPKPFMLVIAGEEEENAPRYKAIKLF